MNKTIHVNNALPPGWYAGPYPDEVYYRSHDGKWFTSLLKPSDETPPYELVPITEVPPDSPE